MGSLMMQLNLDVLKVPLGFIRLVELPLSIIAFSSLVGFGRETTYQASNVSTCEKVTIRFGYPFALDSMVPKDSCTKDSGSAALFHETYTSTSQFFVFVGVITMLYCLAILAVYLVLWHKYERDDRYAIVDTVATAVLFVFWLFGTIFWMFNAFGVGTVTSATAIEKALSSTDKACKVEGACKLQEGWGYAGLAISVVGSFIAGFGCLVLMLGNVWFVYKETVWFRNRQTAAQAAQVGAGPYAPTGDMQ